MARSARGAAVVPAAHAALEQAGAEVDADAELAMRDARCTLVRRAAAHLSRQARSSCWTM
jgi:hypothetical protein